MCQFQIRYLLIILPNLLLLNELTFLFQRLFVQGVHCYWSEWQLFKLQQLAAHLTVSYFDMSWTNFGMRRDMMNRRSHRVFTIDLEYKSLCKIVLKQFTIMEQQARKMERLQREIDILEEILHKRLLEVTFITHKR